MVSEAFKKITLVAVTILALLITACSGGGGSGKTYTVTFHSSSAASAETIDVIVNDGETIPSADFPVDFADDPNDGREFLEWSVDPEGKGEIVNEETIIKSDLSLYPIWGSNITDLGDISDLDGTYKLVDDIEVSVGTVPKPIGTGPSSSFTGVIYGNGRTVTGLVLSPEKYTGLFGYISNAYISDLHIGLDADLIEINQVTAAAGGLVGEAVDSTITNVSVSGDMNVTSQDNLYAGLIAGNVVNTSITNSFTTGNLSASANNKAYAGGIAGYLGGTVDSVYVLGEITSATSSTSSSASAYAGGVTGYAEAGSVVSKAVVASGNISSVNTGEIAGGDGGAELVDNYYKDAASTDVLDVEFFKSMGFDFDNAWAEPQQDKLYSLPVAKKGNAAAWVDVTFDTAGDIAVYKVIYDRLTDVSPVPVTSDDFLLWNTQQDGRGKIVKEVKTTVPMEVYGILGKIIGGADEFMGIANEVTVDSYYMLDDDIDLAGSGIVQPIGDATEPFSSVIYGEGHTISGITLADTADTGLFGYLEGAYISDLILETNTVISGTDLIENAGALAGVIGEDNIIDNITVNGIINIASTAAKLNVGGIAGKANSDISNSTVNADVYGETSSGLSYVGGLVGIDNSTITKSTSSGTVSAKVYGTGDTKAQAGGIAGEIGSNGIITETYSTANVTAYAKGTTGESTTSAGGIVGYNHGLIFATYSTGDVIANTDTDKVLTFTHRANAGGIVGKSKGIVAASYATGDIESHSFTTAKSAGIAADLRDAGAKVYRSVGANETLTAKNNIIFGIGQETHSGRVIGQLDGASADVKHNYANVEMKLNDNTKSPSDIDGTDKTMNSLMLRQTYDELNGVDITGAEDLIWDFENTWEIEEGQSLPTFQWQK